MRLYLLIQKIKIELSFDLYVNHSLILCVIELVLIVFVLLNVEHVIVGHEPVDCTVFVEAT